MHCPSCQTPVPTSFWKFPGRHTTCAHCDTPLTLVLPPGSRVAYYTLVFFFSFLFLLFLFFGFHRALAEVPLPAPWPGATGWFASAFIFMLLGRWLIGVYRMKRGLYLPTAEAPSAGTTFAVSLPYMLVGLLAGMILAVPVFAIWGFNKQVTLLFASRCGGADQSMSYNTMCLKVGSMALLTGADPNFATWHDDTEPTGAFWPSPLNEAIRHKNWGMVLLLLDQGADPNSNKDGTYPIFEAVQNAEVFRLLVEYGARTDIIGGNGRTLLWEASFSQNGEVIEQLIDSGNNPNRPDKHGVTPFLIGCRYWNVDLVRTVLKRGGNPEQTDQRGANAVHYAARNKDSRVLTLLAEQQLPLNSKTTNGRTPLWFGAQAGLRDNMEVLLQRGVPADTPDAAGATPLFVTMEQGDRKAARLLIEYGADPNRADARGLTPLHVAVAGTAAQNGKRGYDAELVALLLNHKANVHARALAPEKRGAGGVAPDFAATRKQPRDWAPLHEAAQSGFVSAARLLLDAGADPNVMTLDHRTPLSLAQKNGHLELTALLKARGAMDFPAGR